MPAVPSFDKLPPFNGKLYLPGFQWSFFSACTKTMQHTYHMIISAIRIIRQGGFSDNSVSIFIVQTGDKSQSNPPRCFDPNTERPWQNSTACKGHYHQAFNSVIISYLSFNPSVNQTIFLPFPKFEGLLFLSGLYVFFLPSLCGALFLSFIME